MEQRIGSFGTAVLSFASEFGGDPGGIRGEYCLYGNGLSSIRLVVGEIFVLLKPVVIDRNILIVIGFSKAMFSAVGDYGYRMFERNRIGRI